VATSQRVYESACPGCGAAAAFRSAASTHAVCGYCQSTLVRHGDALENLGKAAETFDDYSPLQLYAQGEQGGKAFTLLGRLQYDSPTGRWMEWLAQFDDGRTRVLSEDNGSFVWLAPMKDVNNVPDASRLTIGENYALLGSFYTATAVQTIKCLAAQGEFCKPFALNAAFTHAELRSPDGTLLTIAYDADPPSVYLGKAVALDSLKLTGLKDSSSAAIKGRQFNCPNCASPVEPKLETSKAMTCAACHSIIDLSQGIGGELRHALQDEPIRPQIALGTVGTLEGKSWQVVGYQHRVGSVLDNNDDSESFGWEEYLLYNAKAGFQFLCDTSEGWSLVRPATGAPNSKNGKDVSYLGATYWLKDSYTAITDYVAGEFYWPVKRDYKTFNQDYASGAMLLNREQAGQEINWSIGSRLGHQTVMQAFGIKDEQAALFKRDAAPNSLSLEKIVTWVIVGLMVLVLISSLTRCDSRRDCQNQFNPNSSLTAQQQYDQCQRGSRSGGGGGSYGGYSSGGGGHK
jgi:Domain of unknown function (DUF4178)